MGASAVPLTKLGDWDEMAALGKEGGADITLRAPVLANTTSVGMQPNVDETPVPAVRPPLPPLCIALWCACSMTERLGWGCRAGCAVTVWCLTRCTLP